MGILTDQAHVPPSRIGSKMDVGVFFQVSPPTVDAWIRKGMPIVQRGRRGIPWEIDLLEVARWRFSPAVEVGDGDVNPELMQPKERLDWYKGSQARRADALEAGEVVKADEARDAMATMLKSTMLALDTMTEVVEREAKLTPTQSGAVQRIIDRERRALSAALMATQPEQ